MLNPYEPCCEKTRFFTYAETKTQISFAVTFVFATPLLSKSKCLTHMSLVVRKPAFCICENKDADQLHGNPKLISAFVFAIRIVQSLYYQNPKFQTSSHLLWLYSPVCVRPGREPRRPFFSERGSYVTNGLSNPYHLDESTLIFRAVKDIFFIFISFFDEIPVSKQHSPR